MVLPVSKVANRIKFSEYRPISLLACLSKIFEILLAFRLSSVSAVVLKVTKNIRPNMEEGQVRVLVLLDFPQGFDIGCYLVS
jgi:hypothetical protein